MFYTLSLYIYLNQPNQLQTCKIQLQTLQTQKNPISSAYSNVTSRIDTVRANIC